MHGAPAGPYSTHFCAMTDCCVATTFSFVARAAKLVQHCLAPAHVMVTIQQTVHPSLVLTERLILKQADT